MSACFEGPIRRRAALITGAAGFLGIKTAQAFVRSGWDVWGLDRRPSSAWAGKARRLLTTDLLSSGWEPVLDHCDVVVHLAGRAGARDLDSSAHQRDNVMATEAVLRAVAGRRAVRVIFASSSSVYGQRATGAMCETDSCRPLHPYGVSKLHAEQALLGTLGNRCTALRLFTVYGPGQRSEMLVASAIRAAVSGIPMDLHDERVRRDLTYIDDVIHAILAAARRPGVHGVINVGGGVARSVDDVLALVTRHLDKAVPIKRAASGLQPSRTLADLARARALLDYQPMWSLSDGVARQIASHPPYCQAPG